MATPRTVPRNRNEWNTSAYNKPSKKTGLIINGETEFVRTKRKLGNMKSERSQLEPVVREIASVFAPSRVRLESFVHADQMKRHRGLLNNRPMIAARTMASGLHAGLTSPARPWFRLLTPDKDLSEFGPMRTWLTHLERQTQTLLARSNIYTALPYIYGEVGLFGTNAMLSLEGDNGLRFEPFTFGQYWIARNEFGVVDTLYTVTQMSIRNVVDMFGIDNVSQSTRDKYNNATNREAKCNVLRAIEPNVDRLEGWGARAMAFQCVYWELDSKRDDDAPLRRAGFHHNPILSSAWEYTVGDTYGSSCPGLLGLGPALGLQVNERNKAQAIQRSDNPPMQGPTSLVKSGINLLPGAFNAVDMSNPNARIQSLYDYRPDIQARLNDIASDEAEINEALFVDLFLMLQNDARSQPPTAEEIRARYEEKVLALGPTLEQFNGGLLSPLIERATDYLIRQSLPYWEGRLDGEPVLPPPPKELQGQSPNVDFISSLQQAQRAASLTNIERFGSFVGSLMQMDQSAADKFDIDQAIDEYGTGLNVPGGMVRSDDDVLALRQGREKAAQSKQMMEAAPAMKDAADAISTAATTVPADNSLLQSLSGMATGIGTAGA